MLRLVSEHSGHPLAIPEMVLEEYLSYRKIELKKKIAAARDARQHMLAMPSWPGQVSWNGAELPDLDGVVADLETELRARFQVLPLTSAAAVEALKREARRQAPASTDDDNPGGARDAAIWLAVVDVCRIAMPGEVYFVATDNDFGKKQLLPALAAEAPANLVLCKGMDKVIELLAKPAEATTEEVERDLATSNVGRAVQQAISGPDVLNRIATSVPGMAGVTVHSVGSEQIKMLGRDLQKTHTYMLGENRIVTAELRWKVGRRYATVTPGGGTWTVGFTVNCTVVLVLRPEDGAFRGIYVPHRSIVDITGELVE